MPVPAFVPIIGSSFDSVGNQVRDWAGFNAAIEQNNMQRLAAAEIARNQWLQNVAAQQQAAQNDALNRQIASDQYATQLLWNRAQSQQSQENWAKQFAEGVKESKDRIAAERERTRAMYDYRTNQENAQLNAVKNYAQAAAPEVQKLSEQTARNEADLIAASNELNTVVSQIKSTLPDTIRYNEKNGQFEVAGMLMGSGPKVLEPLIQKAAEANRQVASATTKFQSAQLKYDNSKTMFDQALEAAQKSYGLLPQNINGKWNLFSPQHGQGWGGGNANVGSAASGFTPAPAQVPSGLKVGRFIVVPE